MRQRKPADPQAPSSPRSSSSSSKAREEAPHSLLQTHGFVFLLLSLVILAVWHFGVRLPPVKSDAATPLHAFSEERSRAFLQQLMDIGYRPLGSVPNDIETVDALLRVINDIQQKACKKSPACPKIEVKIHHANGASMINIVGTDIATKFHNVTNILVKVEPRTPIQTNAKKSILINSHFDSAIGGIGANDAGGCIAVMVEVFRNIMNSNDEQFSLNYPLIFMFNGAEETGLLGALGFADGHPWAKEIAFVVNMDAAGTGAASLFQQNSDRVLRTFAAYAPHPHTSSFAVDIFKSGKFPGDTDYRIFRDNLGAPGADFGFYRDGYMYHTLIDDLAHMRNGTLQHMGANLLALLHGLSFEKVLEQPETTYLGAFFDIFGYHLVLLTQSQVRTISFVLIALSCIVVCWDSRQKKFDFNITRFFPAFLTTLLGMAFGAVCTLGNAFLVLYLHPLSWFSHRLLIIPLFVVPVIFGQVAAQYLLYQYSARKYNKSAGRPRWVAELKLNASSAVLLIFCLTLFVAMEYGFSFYFLVGVAFLLLSKIFENIFAEFSPLTKILYVICISFPLALLVDIGICAIQLLTPVMGRVGPAAPTEIVIAAITILPTVFVVVLVAPLLHRPPNFFRFLKPLVLIAAAGLLISFFVFPYTRDTPKRIYLQHSKNFDTGVSEIAVTGYDPVPVAPSFLFDTMRALHAKGLYTDKAVTTEAESVFPYAMGLQKQLYKTFPAAPEDWQGVFPSNRRLFGAKYFAAPPSFSTGEVSKPVMFVESDKFDAVSNNRSLTVLIDCKEAMWTNIRFKGPLLGWDIPGKLPAPNADGYYHVRLFVGQGKTSWKLQLSFNGKEPITFRAVGTYVRSSTLLENIHAVLPDWMTPTIFTATIASYTF